jgi:hypothetical protein
LREQDSDRAEAAREKFLATLNAEVLKPEVLDAVYERVAKKVKDQFAHVPEELRLKRIELNRAESRVTTSSSSSRAVAQRQPWPTRSPRPRSR